MVVSLRRWRARQVHESFAWPTRTQAWYLVLNASLALVFNVSILLGVAFTSATLTSPTLSTSLNCP